MRRTKPDASEPAPVDKVKVCSRRRASVVARVLVVDDEPSILTSTAALLRESGFDVATCDDAGRIRETVEVVTPDVLLQDVWMPGLDVGRLLSGLREDPRWRKLPVVLFTAGMNAEEISQRLGVAVLEKPYRPGDLVRAIEKAMQVVAA